MADFATDDKGGDLIDLVRYLDGCTDVEACNKLADLLCVTAQDPPSKPTPSKSPTPDWVAIQPIPAEAMNKCPAKHRQHGTPSKIWIYRDAQGHPLMALYRFDLGMDEEGKPKKVFAPLTWCQRSDTQATQWRWQGLPEPRPLLRLHELTLQPDATVVLCEGEKAADAAAVLFPNCVATCWPNGSKAWHNADLAPLKNRTVWLWPDNDPSATDCMEAVAQKLEDIGAKTEQHRSNQDPEPYHSLKSSRMPPFRHHCDVVGEFRFEHSLRHVHWRMRITGITAARRSLALPPCSLSDLNDRQLLAVGMKG